MTPSVYKKDEISPLKKAAPFLLRRAVKHVLNELAPDLSLGLKDLVVTDVLAQWKQKKYPRAAQNRIIEELVTFKLEEMGYFQKSQSQTLITPPGVDSLNESLLQWLGGLDKKFAIEAQPISNKPVTTFSTPPSTAIARLFKYSALKQAPGDLGDILFQVAKAAALQESAYAPMSAENKLRDSFFSVMSEGRFIPDLPLIQKILAQGSAANECALLKTTGEIDARLECIKWATLFDQDNYDITLDLSDLLPGEGESDVFLGFINLLQQSLQTHKTAYLRPKKRILVPLDHPEIQSIVEYMGNPSHYFSFTFAVTQNFMRALLSDGEYLTSTRTSSIKARDMAWRLASLADKDMDLLISDHVPAVFQATSGAIPTASGLQLLYPDHALIPGFINLTAFLQNRDINWQELSKTLKTAVHLMDNLPIAGPAKPRQLSIGVTGWAEILESMKMSYASEEAFLLAKRLARFMLEETTAASKELGQKRGSLLSSGKRHMTVLGLGNTENVSILFGQKGGISPLAPQTPETVLKLQAIFQEQSDNLVCVPVRLDKSKTNPRDVLKLILLANKLHLPLLSIRRSL